MNNIKDKNPKHSDQKSAHHIETPTPPQVMDPSSAPGDQKNRNGKTGTEKKGKPESDKKINERSLAPREEL